MSPASPQLSLFEIEAPPSTTESRIHHVAEVGPAVAPIDPEEEAAAEQLRNLRQLTVSELRQARGHWDQERQAMMRLFARGALQALPQAALIDLLGVDEDNALEQAGYTDEEARAVMDELASIQDDEIEAMKAHL